MDIIEFVEKTCGCELLSWQKELLKRVDDLPRDHKLVYCLARRRWAIVKESELSKTSIVPFQHEGYHSRIAINDDVEAGQCLIREKITFLNGGDYL